MTNDDVKRASMGILDYLEKQIAEPNRFSFWKKLQYDEDARDHIAWMLGEIEGFLSQGRKEKAVRWLGFIQGVLWARGMMTIGELREMNKPTEVIPNDNK